MPHGLTAGQRALLRETLTQQQHALDAQLKTALAGTSRVEHTHEVLAQDGDDAPQRLMEREVDMARTDRTLSLLGAVSATLKRVDEPGYGLCAQCGEGIAFDRLKLEPWATRCVGCESQQEKASAATHRAAL